MTPTEASRQELVDRLHGEQGRSLEGLLQLHEQGLSVQQLAVELGVSCVEVVRAIQQARLIRG